MKSLKLEYSSKDILNFHISDDESLKWIAEFDSSKFNRIFVIADTNVMAIWGKLILRNLKCHNKELMVFYAKPNEHTKSLKFYPKILDYFEKQRCSRFDLVIAIGGGIILDLASFFCSTYMRGLPFYAVPTTLIGQVDAITAGKTCLNTINGKNTLGTFYYPKEVYNNIAILKTNRPYYARQGFSEIFKYGLLASEKLLDSLDDYQKRLSDRKLIKIIELTINARSIIRKKDALASNLGHTFGHALEKISNFRILHGDAISIGIIMSLYFSVDSGLMSKSKLDEIIERMRKHHLNIYLEKNIDIDQMIDCMLHDKKSSSNKINLVLLRDVENPYENKESLFFPVSPKKMKAFLKSFINSYQFVMENCWGYINNDYIEYS